MARNLLTLFGIDVSVQCVSKSDSLSSASSCPAFRCWWRVHPGSPVNAQSCVTILSSPVVCVEFCESGLAYTQVR